MAKVWEEIDEGLDGIMGGRYGGIVLIGFRNVQASRRNFGRGDAPLMASIIKSQCVIQ